MKSQIATASKRINVPAEVVYNILAELRSNPTANQPSNGVMRTNE
jgi:hypothetical protein